MKTRCKFYCVNILEDESHFFWKLSAVYHNDDPNHENAKFNEASPNGNFDLMVDKSVYKGENPIPGKEYYLDLAEAPPAEAKQIKG